MSPRFQFNGQMRDEKVLLLTKQHPFILLRPALLAGVALLIPTVIYDIAGIGTLLAESILPCLVLAFYLVFRSWKAWNNSMLLLTNKRVLVITQKGFLRREIAGSGLTHIHRVTNQVNGLLPSMLGYGSITIYTDDTQTALTIAAMGDPFGIQQEILEAVSRAESGENQEFEADEED